MTAMPTFREGDEGATIIFTFEEAGAIVDVSAATTRTASFTPPSGVSKPVSCAAGPTAYQTNYTTLASTWDEIGTWRLIAEASGVGFAWHSRVIEVQVEAVY